MRKSFIVATVVTAGVIGPGYLLGPIAGTTPVSAATKHVKGHVRTAQAASTATRHADGKVTAVNGDTITVQADNDPAGSTEYTGVTTIVLSAATTYSGTGTKASITVGSYIVAEGTVSADGKTLSATQVGTGGKGGHGGHGGGGPHADGSVTQVNGDSITVKPDGDPAGSNEYTKVTTILLTATTTFDDGTTRAAIVTGANISSEGTLSADGLTLTATHVDVRGAGTHARHP